MFVFFSQFRAKVMFIIIFSFLIKQITSSCCVVQLNITIAPEILMMICAIKERSLLSIDFYFQ